MKEWQFVLLSIPLGLWSLFWMALAVYTLCILGGKRWGYPRWPQAVQCLFIVGALLIGQLVADIPLIIVKYCFGF